MAKKANEDVAAAIRELKRARGGEVEDTEDAEDAASEAESPKHFLESEPDPVPEPDPEPEYVYETQYPSSDGQTNYRVALTAEGKWSCECEGWRRTGGCKHLERVSSWYEGKQTSTETPQPSYPPPRPVQPPAHAPYNTPMPGQGVMVGGGEAPARAPSQLPPEPHDPWAPRKDTIIQPGATVVMKSKKK